MRNEFHNNKLDSIEKYPNECISNLKGLGIQMSGFRMKVNVSNKDLMNHIPNNVPKE